MTIPHRILQAATGLVTSLVLGAMPAPAKAYQVDCAILLCLSGGWPASPVCSHARAVFIRRITPWPIEPPLQIWRCPMRTAMNEGQGATPYERFRNFAFADAPAVPMQTTVPVDGIPKLPAAATPRDLATTIETVFRSGTAPAELDDLLQKIAGEVSNENGTADIDISGPEFDFIRTIRVWDVRYYQHRRIARAGECIESSNMYLGTYGAQGEYNSRRIDPDAAPSWVLPTRSCGSRRRGVGVEWRDYQGNHGYEWVSY